MLSFRAFLEPDLKVPMYEISIARIVMILYTIKSPRVGDFRVKIKNLKKYIVGFIQGKVPYAYDQPNFKGKFI